MKSGGKRFPFYDLVQHAGFDAVEDGQVTVEHHFLSSNKQYRLPNSFHRDQINAHLLLLFLQDIAWKIATCNL